jgi:hypothetical protein
MSLFSLDKNPCYLEYAEELSHILVSVSDVFVLCHDDTLASKLPGVTDYIKMDSPPESWHYFNTAVNRLIEKKVGTFFYSSADDMFRQKDLDAMFLACETDYDAAWANYMALGERHPAEPWKATVDCIWGGDLVDPFCRQSWPECSVYRTSIFAEFPCDPARLFVCSSFKKAQVALKPPVGKRIDDAVLLYYGHNQFHIDHSFMNPKEVCSA